MLITFRAWKLSRPEVGSSENRGGEGGGRRVSPCDGGGNGGEMYTLYQCPENLRETLQIEMKNDNLKLGWKIKSKEEDWRRGRRWIARCDMATRVNCVLHSFANGLEGRWSGNLGRGEGWFVNISQGGVVAYPGTLERGWTAFRWRCSSSSSPLRSPPSSLRCQWECFSPCSTLHIP